MKRSIKIRKRENAAKRPLVLVVDDYSHVRELYSEYVSYSGHRVAEAPKGAPALAKAFEILPDVILIDVSLPVMDGWEPARRLRADFRARAVPVLALSGCDTFVTKPSLPEHVVGEVRRILRAPRQPKVKN